MAATKGRAEKEYWVCVCVSIRCDQYMIHCIKKAMERPIHIAMIALAAAQTCLHYAGPIWYD